MVAHDHQVVLYESKGGHRIGPREIEKKRQDSLKETRERVKMEKKGENMRSELQKEKGKITEGHENYCRKRHEQDNR